MAPLFAPYCFGWEDDAAIGRGRRGRGGDYEFRGRRWCAPAGAVGSLVKAGYKVSQRVERVIALGHGRSFGPMWIKKLAARVIRWMAVWFIEHSPGQGEG